MQSIVGASVSSNAMDAQVREERLVWRGWCGTAGAGRMVRPKLYVEYDVDEYSFGTCLSRLQRTHSVECERS